MLYNLFFKSSYLPFSYKVIVLLTYTFSIVMALTIHEFAHAFSANKLGDNTAKRAGRLTLNPLAHFDVLGLVCFIVFGLGWAKPVPINAFNLKKVKRDTLIVSLAGVCANFILLFVFCPLSMLLQDVVGSSTILLILYYLCAYTYRVNLAFMVFNLLPIYPLDGFNAIASQLKYNNKFVDFMHRYGHFILMVAVFVFSLTGIFDYLVYYVGYPVNWLWSLILGR